MTTSIITVTSSWQQMFQIDLYGNYVIHIEELAENNCKGSIIFLEEGSSLRGEETSVGETRGINIQNFLTRRLPLTFNFYDSSSRVYEIRKNSGFLEVRLISGTDISTKFTLFSGFPDKEISYTFRENNSNKSSFYRLGTYNLPKVKKATAKAVSWMDNDVTSYSIIILDRSNKMVLLEVTLSNTYEGVQDLGSLINTPSTSTQIEISVKKNGGNGNSKVYIESVNISYN